MKNKESKTKETSPRSSKDKENGCCHQLKNSEYLKDPSKADINNLDMYTNFLISELQYHFHSFFFL